MVAQGDRVFGPEADSRNPPNPNRQKVGAPFFVDKYVFKALYLFF